MANSIMATVGIVMFIFSFIGNITVLYLFKRFRSLRTVSNVFVLNLTIADFIHSVSNIPPFVISSLYERWMFGVIGCKVYAFIGSTTSITSIITLAAIAVDRCLVIVKIWPMKTSTTGKTTHTIVAVCIWIYSIAWSCTPLLGFGSYILDGSNTSCTFDYLKRTLTTRLHVLSAAVFHFFAPLIIIVCSYAMIFRTVSKHVREFRMVTGVRDPSSVRLNGNNRGVCETNTARASLVITIAFCLSWAPYAGIALIGQFGDVSMIQRLSVGITCILAKGSTVVNPVIYALIHPKFRKMLEKTRVCTSFQWKRLVKITPTR